MSGFYAQDNRFNQLMTKVFDLCLLNFLGFVCCIPIVTAGASFTAMYAVMLKMVKDKEGPIIKSFIKEFKSNLKGSIGMWLVLLAGFCVLIFDIVLWTQNEVEYRSLFWGITVAMIVFLCALSDWYFALRAKFVDDAKTSIKNALKYIVVYLPVSVLMGLYSVGMVYVLTRYPMLVMFIPVFGLSIVMYPKAIYIQRKFEKYLEDRGEVEIDEKNPDDFSLDIEESVMQNEQDTNEIMNEETNMKKTNDTENNIEKSVDVEKSSGEEGALTE